MSKYVSHAVSTREPYITPRAIIDYYMAFSILALVLARDSHIKPDSKVGGLI